MCNNIIYMFHFMCKWNFRCSLGIILIIRYYVIYKNQNFFSRAAVSGLQSVLELCINFCQNQQHFPMDGRNFASVYLLKCACASLNVNYCSTAQRNVKNWLTQLTFLYQVTILLQWCACAVCESGWVNYREKQHTRRCSLCDNFNFVSFITLFHQA
jgi:hypothetical protein